MLEVELSDTGEMRVRVPGTGEGRGHDLYIPITVEGLRVLKRLLIERKSEGDGRIGTAKAPTEHQIKMWLAAEKAAVPKGKLNVAKEVKAEIARRTILDDLDLGDLDIKL